MNRKQVVLSIFAALFFVGISITFFIQNQILNSEYTFYNEQISPFIVTDITLNKKTYTLGEHGIQQGNTKKIPLSKKHTVAEVGYFSLLARTDPLFAIEDTDPNELQKSISSLESSLDILSSFYSQTEQGIIIEHFYPLSFLKSLSQLERARKTLIKTPGINSLKTYHELLTATAQEYRIYTDKIERLYRENVLPEGNTTSAYFGGYSNSILFLDFLKNLREDANVLEEKVIRRINCMDTNSCPSLSLKTVTELNADATTKLTDEYLNSIMQNIHIIHGVRKYEPGYHRPTSTPIFILNEHYCGANEERQAYFLWWILQEDGTRSIITENVNDLYFYDVQEINKKNPSTYLTSIEKTGIHYLSQRISNLYMCPDQGKDTARLTTLHALYSELVANPIFNTDDIRDLFPELAKQEEFISHSQILSDSDMEKYLTLVHTLLTSKTEPVLAKEIGSPNVLLLESLLHRWRQQSAHFDILINTVVETNNGLQRIIGTGNSIEVEQLFVTRSYPIVTLLTFNPTVVSTPSISYFRRVQDWKEYSKLSSYREELSTILTPEEVVELMLANDTKMNGL